MSTQTNAPSPKEPNHKIAAALVHVVAMILLATGSALFAILLPLAALLAIHLIEKDNAYLKGQMWEVFQYQAITITISLVLVFSLVLAALSASAGLTSFLATATFAFYGVTLIMPIFAAIRLLQGRFYAYPLIFSPRRKVYLAAERARKEGANADDTE